MAQAVASNAAAAQTIHDALIEAGVDLDRARADSAVYYPDLLPQVSCVATQPHVIDAVRAIQGEGLNRGNDAGAGARGAGAGARDAGAGVRDAGAGVRDAGAGAEIDACDVFGVILSITFVAACTAPIL
jgi:hypothetical protein